MRKRELLDLGIAEKEGMVRAAWHAYDEQCSAVSASDAENMCFTVSLMTETKLATRCWRTGKAIPPVDPFSYDRGESYSGGQQGKGRPAGLFPHTNQR